MIPVSAPAKWWWLSFVDRLEDELGNTAAMHLGVTVIPADSFEDAVEAAWITGSNPGGEVAGFEMPAWDISWAYAYRLIEGDEIANLQREVAEAKARTEDGVRWHAV